MLSEKKNKILVSLIGIVFWLLIWEMLSRFVGLSFVIPGVFDTFSALITLVISFEFWQIIISSFLRIIIGYIIGVLFGGSLAFLCCKSQIINSIVSKFMTVIKATPVASVIMIIWFMVGSPNVPWIISTVMVMPIIWQNIIDGYKAIDNNLIEVTKIFNFSFIKKLKVLIFPSLKSYILPAMVTTGGLAWKAGIAAEIIAYTDFSIGKEIFNAKAFLESAEMYAWTVIVVALSILFEMLIKIALRRIKNA